LQSSKQRNSISVLALQCPVGNQPLDELISAANIDQCSNLLNPDTKNRNSKIVSMFFGNVQHLSGGMVGIEIIGTDVRFLANSFLACFIFSLASSLKSKVLSLRLTRGLCGSISISKQHP
jgi:hypothetical protein